MEQQTVADKFIRISEDTKSRLDDHKHPGQSYDGVVVELLDLADKVEEEELKK